MPARTLQSVSGEPFWLDQLDGRRQVAIFFGHAANPAIGNGRNDEAAVRSAPRRQTSSAVSAPFEMGVTETGSSGTSRAAVPSVSAVTRCSSMSRASDPSLSAAPR